MAKIKKNVNNEKAKYWAFVAYPDSLPENWQEILISTGLPCVVSPLHDADINADDTQKKPHYHIIMCFSNTTTYTNAKKITDDVVKILGTTNNISMIVKQEVDNIVADDTISDKQYIKKINLAKKNIVEKTKKIDNNKIVKIYLSALDEAKKIILNTPGVPKKVLLSEFISQANGEFGRAVNEDLIAKQEPLKYINNSCSTC